MATMDGFYITKKPSFLSIDVSPPNIVKSALDRRQPPELTAARFKRMRDLPIDWQQQRRYLGFE